MSRKTAKIVTNKFLNTTKSDREGGRTVGSGRVASKVFLGSLFICRNNENECERCQNVPKQNSSEFGY